MAQWTTSDPGAGSPADIRASAGRRQSEAARTRDAQHNVSLAGAVAGDGWQGAAAGALSARTAALAAEMNALAGQAESDAGALRRYADEVETIKHQQNTLAARRGRLESQLRAAQHQDPVQPVLPDDPARRILERQMTGLRDQIAVLDAQFAALAQQRSAADGAAIMALTSSSSRGGLAAHPAVTSGSVSGIGLSDLAGMSELDLATLFHLHPELATQVQQNAGSAHEVAAWWAALSAIQRQNLVLGAPALIGNLEGVTYRARDVANRIVLDRRIAEEEARQKRLIAPPGGFTPTAPDVVVVSGDLIALRNIRDSLESPAGGGPRFLVSLTADSPPLAAVSIGDLDSADNVTYAVPGMGTTTAGMYDWAESAQNISDAQTRADATRSHAVVAWVGYKAPETPPASLDVFGVELAHAGATKLVTALEGFAALRTDAQLNVVAHSYGSTTAAAALSRPGVHVDSLAIVGSAGLPATIDSASDLHADQIFAGQAQDVMSIDPAGGDQWAWVGRLSEEHPVNPIDPSFGAKGFSVAGTNGMSPVTDHAVSTSEGNGYLDPGTESLRNVAFATVGRGSEVTPYEPPHLTPFQEALLSGLARGH
ncbi:alpha/beta hydrolase [Microbacterium sp. F1-18]